MSVLRKAPKFEELRERWVQAAAALGDSASPVDAVDCHRFAAEYREAMGFHPSLYSDVMDLFAVMMEARQRIHSSTAEDVTTVISANEVADDRAISPETADTLRPLV